MAYSRALNDERHLLLEMALVIPLARPLHSAPTKKKRIHTEEIGNMRHYPSVQHEVFLH